MNKLLLLISIVMIVLSKSYYLKTNVRRLHEGKNFDRLLLGILLDGFGSIIFVLMLAERAKELL